MDIGASRSDQALHGALDQILTSLGQHGDGDVVGNEVVLDEQAYEVEVELGSGREAYLDLLVPHRDQQLEHGAFAYRGHRANQCLVAVTKISRRRAGGGYDAPVGPGSVR